LASSSYETDYSSLYDIYTGTTQADLNDISFDGPPAQYILGVMGSTDPLITISFAPANAVPEPATFGFFGAALGLLGMLRWRRRKA
jgi:hypothetical protein